MRMLTGQESGSRRRRGVSLLMFILIALPIFLFSTALAVDISQLIVDYNRNINIAEAAAEAGATARDVNTGQLDSVEAARRADTVCQMLGAPACAYVNGPTVTASVPMQSFPLYGNWFRLPNGSTMIDINWGAFTASRTASVCNSYTPTGSSDQYCVRPGD